MVLTAFATSRPLQQAELDAAPVRYPRPSALLRPLKVDGAKARQAAQALSLNTIGDLLEHLPRDRRESRSVAELVVGESATVVVQVRAISSRPVRRRGMRPLVEATVADASGPMKATFFNQPWLVKRYPPGTRLVLHGKLQARNRFSVQAHARTAEAIVDGGGVAHYPATDGLSSTQILALVSEHADDIAVVFEPLSVALARRRAAGRPGRRAERGALPGIGGDSDEGRRRLAFDELLLAQLALLRRRGTRDQAGAPGARRAARADRAVAVGNAPVRADRRPGARAGGDRRRPGRARPMQRLLMGEVGSGKTVVALYAMLRAVEHGYQGALMAPTETLAEQHFATIQSLMPGEAVPAGLLTGSTPAGRRADLLGKLSSGELSLIVGTHALIEDAVRFARLGVAVVDEQHRFGVRQRAALDAKGVDPTDRTCCT